MGDESSEAAKVAVRPRSVVVEDLVRFAGERITVRRSVPVGSAEEQRRVQAQKRRRRSELGGQLAGLDALLGNAGTARAVSVVEKSEIDWHQHKEETGIRDRERDPHVGASGFSCKGFREECSSSPLCGCAALECACLLLFLAQNFERPNSLLFQVAASGQVSCH